MYEGIEDLPKTLRDVLPEEAHELYLEAYNEAWEDYDEETSSEMGQAAVANREGWRAVREEFVQNEETGEWHRKGEEPEQIPEEEDEVKGFLDQVTHIV